MLTYRKDYSFILMNLINKKHHISEVKKNISSPNFISHHVYLPYDKTRHSYIYILSIAGQTAGPILWIFMGGRGLL